MENFAESPRIIFSGKLTRDYFISAGKEIHLDEMGGNLIYAAAGFKLWETSSPPGLVARIGEDYPQNWLDAFSDRGFDPLGINILPEAVDVRDFYVYESPIKRVSGDPVPYFARLGISFPKALLGYRDNSLMLNSRTALLPISLRQGDIPDLYLEGVSAHLCPLDYLTHSLLPAVFRQAGFTLITLDPATGYMNPTYWNDIPALVTGLTAFMPSEEDLRSLFQGKTDDLWEMAEHIGSYGCDFVVIKRGIRGQVLYDATAKKRYEISAYPAKVENLTGVGDAFCGGFIAGYRRTYDPVEAVLYGNISASVTAEGVGPFYGLDVLPGLPEARLESIRQTIRKV